MSQPHAFRAHRIRQLVWACESLASADDLKRLLDLGEPFADPGVAEFGLENAVFAIGDQFLEGCRGGRGGLLPRRVRLHGAGGGGAGA